MPKTRAHTTAASPTKEMVAYAKQVLDDYYHSIEKKPDIWNPFSLDSLGDLIEYAEDDPEIYELIATAASDLLRRNEKMPDWLAQFAAEVLEGKMKCPRERGRKNVSDARSPGLWKATKKTAKAFGLPHYTNEGSEKLTAAEVVAKAAGCSTDTVIVAYKEEESLRREQKNDTWTFTDNGEVYGPFGPDAED